MAAERGYWPIGNHTFPHLYARRATELASATATAVITDFSLSLSLSTYLWSSMPFNSRRSISVTLRWRGHALCQWFSYNARMIAEGKRFYRCGFVEWLEGDDMNGVLLPESCIECYSMLKLIAADETYNFTAHRLKMENNGIDIKHPIFEKIIWLKIIQF